VGIDSVKLAEHLWDRQRIVVIPIKHEQFEAIRVTPNVYSTLDEVDIFVDAMKRALTKGVLLDLVPAPWDRWYNSISRK
jgi:isopenicillin-N epimerase